MRSRSCIAPTSRVALHHHIQHALVFVAELVLVQLAEPHAGLQHHFAGARFEVAAQDLHQRGLAAAVGADQAIAVAVGELDRDVLEQRLGVELDGEVGGREHGVPVGAASTAGRAALAERPKPWVVVGCRADDQVGGRQGAGF